MLANVRNRRVKILPERLHTRLVFPLVLLFVAQTDLVGLIIYVRRELLLVQIVDYAIHGLVVFAGRMG